MSDARPHGPLIAVVETGRGEYGLQPLLRARELGLSPILVTDDLSRYATSEAARSLIERTVHAIVDADTRDSASVTEALRPYAERGDLAGVLAVIDYYVPVVAETARRLGLPGLDPEAARTARNKLRTREVCAELGVPAPRFSRATAREDAVAAARSIGFPCVVKPLTESASIGVRLCRDTDEVAAHYDELTASPVDMRGMAKPGGVLVEEYLTGYELSVEVLTTAKGPQVVGVTDKALTAHPYFVETGETFPTQLPDSVRDEVTRAALDALKAIGHDFGAAHVEIKVTPDGPRLVEINARMGGAQIGRIIHEATGLDLLREVVRLHVGQEPEVVVEHTRAAASRYLTAADDGVLRGFEGEDLVRRLPGVVAVDLYAAPGGEVRRPRSNADVLGHVVVRADTPAEAARWADTAAVMLAPAVDAPC
ncbi:ATP-grasp domain-containing protein [Streptomyces griseiscabiei]|uniref:ATP-grasp domain-containing protein n=1 Tax=Streptomyces griseiscabiei TaxID=2993540 RepID=A0ABU4LFV9_9ACTN|nr:ATP-grasp domain-containing protein [Streptomyces griseiscabiei]MBZ3902730.1 ATP-grasp domain-containing protein [Streptomyces griseiscabiei]MDX2914079.1 ATP-grasp domain-containing protein [Streptomyces griseiscabiei]